MLRVFDKMYLQFMFRVLGISPRIHHVDIVMGILRRDLVEVTHIQLYMGLPHDTESAHQCSPFSQQTV